MKPDAVKDLAELPFCLRATDLARALNVSQSRAYEIMNTPRFSGGACRQNEDRDKPALTDWLKENRAT